MQLEIKVETDTLKKSDTIIVGIIFVEDADGSKFPGEGWYDFPVTIMGWWLNETIRLLKRSSKSVELLFMDGPEFMRASMGENADSFRVELMKPIRDGEKVVSALFVDARKFAESLTFAARKLLQACERRNWQTDDVATLRDNLQKFMKAMEDMQ